MSNPTEKDVEKRQVAGYTVTVVLLVWPDGEISYDLYRAEDEGTLEILNDESFDHVPTDDEVLALLRDQLGTCQALRGNVCGECEDPYFTTFENMNLCHYHWDMIR